MQKLLKMLKGKKSTILSIIALIGTYCLTKGYVGPDEALLINGVLVILGAGANLLDYKMGINVKK